MSKSAIEQIEAYLNKKSELVDKVYKPAPALNAVTAFDDFHYTHASREVEAMRCLVGLVRSEIENIRRLLADAFYDWKEQIDHLKDKNEQLRMTIQECESVISLAEDVITHPRVQIELRSNKSLRARIDAYWQAKQKLYRLKGEE